MKTKSQIGRFQMARDALLEAAAHLDEFDELSPEESEAAEELVEAAVEIALDYGQIVGRTVVETEELAECRF